MTISDVISDTIWDYEDGECSLKTTMSYEEKKEFLDSILFYEDSFMYENFNFDLVIESIRNDDYEFLSKVLKVLDTPPFCFQDEKKWLEVCNITEEEIQEFKEINKVLWTKSRKYKEKIMLTTADKVDDVLKDNPELKAIKLNDTLSKSEKEVLDISKEYNWEHSNILGLITMYKMNENLELPDDFDASEYTSKLICKTIRTADEVVGFYIIRRWDTPNFKLQYYKDGKKEYCFNFIFIKPQYRNKGYFKNLLRKFMNKYECISFDGVESDILKNALEKRKFKKLKPCNDGRGFYYGWIDDELIKPEYKELIEKNDSLIDLLNSYRKKNRELEEELDKLKKDIVDGFFQKASKEWSDEKKKDFIEKLESLD